MTTVLMRASLCRPSDRVVACSSAAYLAIRQPGAHKKTESKPRDRESCFVEKISCFLVRADTIGVSNENLARDLAYTKIISVPCSRAGFSFDNGGSGALVPDTLWSEILRGRVRSAND